MTRIKRERENKKKEKEIGEKKQRVHHIHVRLNTSNPRIPSDWDYTSRDVESSRYPGCCQARHQSHDLLRCKRGWTTANP